jgi:Zn finger protein HypA/HybF involved in hydrogenase expression
MNSEEKQHPRDRLETAYEKMLERVHTLLGQPGNRISALRGDLEQARETAVELGELSREEADKVATYLERDLHDAAVFIAETGQELQQWWRFDLQQVEERLLDMFISVADQTSLQLQAMNEDLRRAEIYYAGEVTGPGTLVCNDCGQEFDFHKPGRIAPCSNCHGRAFRRLSIDE